MTDILVHLDGVLPRSVRRQLLGGKAANLMELQQHQLPVPSYYVVTTSAFRFAMESAGLSHQIAEFWAEAFDQTGATSIGSSEITDLIQQVDLPDLLQSEIRNAHSVLFPTDALLAVRSSAIDEVNRLRQQRALIFATAESYPSAS